MKVFLSYAVSQYEGALASRLRAVALAYDVELLLPTAENRNLLPPENKQKIKQSDAVIVLVTNRAAQRQSVNLEILEASKQKKPIIALVENRNLVNGLPPNQVIVFNRHNPTQHESQLFEALRQIQIKKNTTDTIAVLGAIGLVALGLLALGELAKESNGK